MGDVRVVAFTSDGYIWAMYPFAYLFNVYWSAQQPVLVVGYTPPYFQLPGNFSFYSVAQPGWGPNRWTDKLIAGLNAIPDDIFVLMLDDYWLCRTVDCRAVASLADYMRDHQDVLRIDLTADRAMSTRAVDVDTWGCLDIIETDRSTSYQWSTQACLVNREHMLACLKPGKTPQEFELSGNDVIPQELRVLGTRQYPVRYVNAVGTGLESQYLYRTEHIRPGIWGTTVERIPAEHIAFMQEHGLLPDGKRLNNGVNR